MKTMSTTDLRAAAKRYDDQFNDGGDGYSPYSNELEDRATAARKAEPICPAARQHDILREVERLTCSAAKMSGTYDAAKVAALRTEYDSLG